MTETEIQLLAEQMQHALDLMKAEIRAIKADQQHQHDFSSHRLTALEGEIHDHEKRLRTATTGVTEFKTWTGLTSGVSSIMSIFAFIRSILM